MQQVQVIPISKIIPNPDNPRTVTDDKFKKLVKSLTDFPEMLEKRPLICVTTASGKYMVLGGNQRLKAAQKANIKELPVLLADEWSEAQRKEFVVKDNVNFGEFDWHVLETQWNTEELIEWGLDMPDNVLPFEEEKPISLPNKEQQDNNLFDGFIVVLKIKSDTFPLVNELIDKMCVEYGIEINIS